MLSRTASTLYLEASCATRSRTLTSVSNRYTRKAVSTDHRSSSLWQGTGAGAWDQILDGVDEPSKPKNMLSRRQGITARESKVLSGMLDMIFDSNKGNKSNISDEEEQVGLAKGKVDDFFNRLRRHSRKGKWVDDLDSGILDRKREQVDYCNSDQELLDWAIREVFEESKQYEAAARLAVTEAEKSPGMKEPPPLQPATYSFMIPILMRTFRDKYHDPHLALSIFNYTKSLSIVSYVFGCSTEAYNELIQTKWECFKDLRGVYQSIDEMIINGVPVNTRTRKWVESVRRDVLYQKGRLDTNETGQNEVWKLLTKIDRLLASSDARSKTSRWDHWKTEVMTDNKQEGDDWSFDNWGDMVKERQPFRRGTTKANDATLPIYN